MAPVAEGLAAGRGSLLMSVFEPLPGSSMFRLECTNLEQLLPFQIERASACAGAPSITVAPLRP
jgi:hypothetical protein